MCLRTRLGSTGMFGIGGGTGGTAWSRLITPPLV
jgi:hypothetical protein